MMNIVRSLSPNCKRFDFFPRDQLNSLDIPQKLPDLKSKLNSKKSSNLTQDSGDSKRLFGLTSKFKRGTDAKNEPGLYLSKFQPIQKQPTRQSIASKVSSDDT